MNPVLFHFTGGDVCEAPLVHRAAEEKLPSPVHPRQGLPATPSGVAHGPDALQGRRARLPAQGQGDPNRGEQGNRDPRQHGPPLPGSPLLHRPGGGPLDNGLLHLPGLQRVPGLSLRPGLPLHGGGRAAYRPPPRSSRHEG